MPELTKDQRAFLARTPQRFRRIYTLAATSNRRQLAIRAFCVHCTGWTPSETRACTGRGCPLYPYRMGGYPGAEDRPDSDADEALENPADGQESPPAPSPVPADDPAPAAPNSSPQPARVDPLPTCAPGTLRSGGRL